MNNDERKAPFTRRLFLQRGVTLASAAVTIPSFLQRSALAMTNWDPSLSSQAGVPEDRILVVVQLAGGNDGLNTVVPFSIGRYYDARKGIAIPEHQTLRLGSTGVGLHPKLDGLKSLYDDGLLSVIQGVGYPNPNRSHFKSMDIWHTADTSGTGRGWLGRYFDNECEGAPQPDIGVAVGSDSPLAMQGREVRPVSFDNPDAFTWRPAQTHERLAETYNEITDEGAPADIPEESSAAFLMRTALDAKLTSEQVRAAVDSKPNANYPRSELADQLRMVAAMIRSGMKTRVYYVSIGGFDTHAGQGGANGRHANRLNQVGGALRAFMTDLKATGDDERTLSMVFSEFGRRVDQNASGGTDHGAAAPAFLIGPMVRPGVHGHHPSLTNLDQGDLKYGIDFRSVYATVLDRWMGADALAVLQRRYPLLNALR